MDKTFEVELIEIDHRHSTHIKVRIVRANGCVTLRTSTDSGSIDNSWVLLPSEAVTIGEQLIAAGKAGEV